MCCYKGKNQNCSVAAKKKKEKRNGVTPIILIL
jgi:hypothetical protein